MTASFILPSDIVLVRTRHMT